MDSIELLDELLRLIVVPNATPAPESEELRKKIMQKWPQHFEPRDFSAALLKIVDDGHAYIKKADEWVEGINMKQFFFYFPTFDGQLFYKHGGYKGDLERRNAERIRMDNMEREQRINAWRTTVLTGILAFFSAVAGIYYIVEMAQPDMLICSISFLTVCFAFIAGAVATLLAVLLWKEIHKT